MRCTTTCSNCVVSELEIFFMFVICFPLWLEMGCNPGEKLYLDAQLVWVPFLRHLVGEERSGVWVFFIWRPEHLVSIVCVYMYE